MHSPTLHELPPPPKGKKGWPWTEETSRLPDTMPEGQPWPGVSIVTPSYNQGRFIEETIRSVLLQGYPDLEYIVIDGGSTDNSVEIIQKYEKWLTYWVSEPDRGQSHAINKGFEKASGIIHGWLNSDDYLLKDALKNVAIAYNVHPEAGAWCGGSLYVDVYGKTVETYWPSSLSPEYIAKWLEHHIRQSACFFSAKAWQKHGPLDEDLHYAMDFDLWLKIAEDSSIEKVNHVLSTDHMHDDAKTQGDVARMYAEIFLVQIRHGYEKFAMEDFSQWMNNYITLTKKLDRISRIPFFRLFMPVARIVWKKA